MIDDVKPPTERKSEPSPKVESVPPSQPQAASRPAPTAPSGDVRNGEASSNEAATLGVESQTKLTSEGLLRLKTFEDYVDEGKDLASSLSRGTCRGNS